MAGKINSPEKVFQEFTDNLKACFGESLKSIVLFGSAAREDYDPKRSDINFLVVMDDNSPSELAKVLPYLSKWRKKRISTPLFLTAGYIESALDTYPVEFFNMKSSYRVLFGEDVLESIIFDPEDIRHQCERELRGKLLHLWQSFLETGGKARFLPGLASQSLKAFVPVFRAILYLVDKPSTGSKESVIREVADHFDLDHSLFDELIGIASKKKKASQEKITALYDHYTEAIERLTNEVDSMVLADKEKAEDENDVINDSVPSEVISEEESLD